MIIKIFYIFIIFSSIIIKSSFTSSLNLNTNNDGEELQHHDGQNFNKNDHDYNYRNLNDKIDIFSSYLNRFNQYYLTNFDEKITTILKTMTIIDTNLKLLQDKAHVWDIFQHHINSWNEHIKSVDHKIELLRLTQQDIQQIDNKINSLEYTINHILTKINQIDHDFKDSIKNILKFDNILNQINMKLENYDNENHNKQLLWNKLNSILKHIITIENSNCRKRRVAEIIRPVLTTGTTTSTTILTTTVIENKLKDIELKIDKLMELKQLIDVQDRNNVMLESNIRGNQNIQQKLNEFANVIEHRNQQLQTSCQSTSNQITTFTDNVDTLLKRIEDILISVKDKFDVMIKSDDNNNCKINSNFNNVTSTSTTETITPITTTESHFTHENSDEIEVDSTNNNNDNFIQPLKNGCHELTKRIDGIYKFRKPDLNSIGRDFNERYCTFSTEGTGWTVIQRRGPYDIQENFNRSWIEYKNGFGSLERDFWFGNEFIYRLVHNDNYELRIELEDFDGVRGWAEYSIFQIDSENYNYTLTLSEYKGSIQDSMLYHHNQQFSTYDRRNDRTLDECCPCAPGYGSGWWFDNCAEANLNGIYRDTPYGHNFIGIVWEHWHDDYSLRKTRMLIRPRNLSENDDSYDDVPEDP